MLKAASAEKPSSLAQADTPLPKSSPKKDFTQNRHNKVSSQCLLLK
jgi:hypothetical protein